MPVGTPNADLFDESRMSFGEHLEELRRCLIRAFAGVAVACVVGFMFAEQTVLFLTGPLDKAVVAYRQRESQQLAINEFGFSPPEWQSWFEEEKHTPEKVYIDPAELLNALESLSPTLTEDIQLRPYEFKAFHFAPGKLSELAQRLLDPSKAQYPSPTELLKSKLSAAEVATLENIAQSLSPTAEDVESVRTIFNRLAAIEKLSAAEEFKPWVSDSASGSFWDFLSPKRYNPLVTMVAMLEENDDEDMNRRINRVLITQCFEEEMPRVKLDLIPMQMWRKIDVNPQALGTTEGFMIWLKAGLFSGLFIAGPWVLWQLWMFVASGLYPHEKRYVYLFLPISLGLFAAGSALAFFFVFEPVLDFLFSFNASLRISPQIRINEWLSFVMFLPLGFGIAFQLPLVMLFLNRINIFSIEVYLSKWRIAVMIIFTLSMLLTPADPISMIMLAIPLTFLYFLGIGLCKWLPAGRNPFGDVAEAT